MKIKITHCDKQELVREGGRLKGSCSLVSMLKKGQNIMGWGKVGGGILYMHCLNTSPPHFVQQVHKVAIFLLLNYKYVMSTDT